MVYRFNDTEIDLAQFTIVKEGKALTVEPKVFDLICYLIENRTRLISRDELFEKVWQGRLVSDATLSNHINLARKALGDGGERQQVIKTVRSRGYQFIAEVEQLTPLKQAANINPHASLIQSLSAQRNTEIYRQAAMFAYFIKYWKTIFILFAVSVLLFIGYWKLPQNKEQPVPYLLVVPFSVAGQDKTRLEPFAAQITREVIQGLRKTSSVRTVPPPSAFTFNTNKTREYIRQQIPDVTYVIDGVLSEAEAGNVRLTVELENLATGALIWDHDFDIHPNHENWFAIQANVATLVTKSLRLVIPHPEKQALFYAHTPNAVAYELYVQGRHQFSLMTYKSVLQAIEYFNQAIELDPKFEAAYLAKSNAYRTIMTVFGKPKDILPKVLSSAVDVIAINPNSAQVMSSLGLAYVHTWQWEDAWKMLNEAQARDPSLSITKLGFALYYSALGNTSELVKALNQADVLDPLNEEIAEWGLWSLMMVNELDAAIEWGEKKLLLHPNKPYPLLSLSVAYYIKGNYEKSIVLAKEGVLLNGREPFPLILLAQAYAASGNFLKAEALVREAQNNEQYLCPYETAVVYNMLGQTQQVYSLLAQAVEYQSNCLIFAKNDPRFENIRKTPNYISILKAIGLDNESAKHYQQ